MTGLYVFEPSLGAKLLGLLKEIAPRTSRVAIVFNPDANLTSWLETAAAEASRIGVEVFETPLRGPDELAATMAQWRRAPDHGVIVLPDPATNAHRKLINDLAARHGLPVVHAQRAAAVEGGLASYGVDLPDVFRQAATYADQILKGDTPANLPVQLPTKFELVVNLKTANALALTIPESFLSRADEVIE